MKSGRKVADILDMINRSDHSSVMAAENCGMEDQKLYKTAEGLENCGYLTVIIVK